MKEKGYLCEDCLERGVITSAEEVHHVIELTEENVNDASISLNKNNLKCLCRICHRARHKKAMPRYKIDKGGHVIPLS